MFQGVVFKWKKNTAPNFAENVWKQMLLAPRNAFIAVGLLNAVASDI